MAPWRVAASRHIASPMILPSARGGPRPLHSLSPRGASKSSHRLSLHFLGASSSSFPRAGETPRASSARPTSAAPGVARQVGARHPEPASLIGTAKGLAFEEGRHLGRGWPRVSRGLALRSNLNKFLPAISGVRFGTTGGRAHVLHFKMQRVRRDGRVTEARSLRSPRVTRVTRVSVSFTPQGRTGATGQNQVWSIKRARPLGLLLMWGPL